MDVLAVRRAVGCGREVPTGFALGAGGALRKLGATEAATPAVSAEVTSPQSALSAAGRVWRRGPRGAPARRRLVGHARCPRRWPLRTRSCTQNSLRCGACAGLGAAGRWFSAQSAPRDATGLPVFAHHRPALRGRGRAGGTVAPLTRAASLLRLQVVPRNAHPPKQRL